MGELKQMGIKAPDQIATPSVRNDSAFLFSVVGEWACPGCKALFLLCDNV
jgi:hypothetical protein